MGMLGLGGCGFVVVVGRGGLGFRRGEVGGHQVVKEFGKLGAVMIVES